MSRLAKNPIPVQEGVSITLKDDLVTVKGKLGELQHQVHDLVELVSEENAWFVKAVNSTKLSKSLVGTTWSIVRNMAQGVSQGYEKKLKLIGVGYRAQVQGAKLNLTLGYSHPIVFEVPKGIKIETPSNTEVVVTGVDKQVVGQVAAKIRQFRKPEPYKGKGVRYVDEIVRKKEAKKK